MEGDHGREVGAAARQFQYRAAAEAVAEGADPASIEGVGKFSGGKNGVEMNAILLAPTPITKDNIQVAIDAGHITKEQACAGVAAGSVPACG